MNTLCTVFVRVVMIISLLFVPHDFMSVLDPKFRIDVD
jgi:hypothetical protein